MDKFQINSNRTSTFSPSTLLCKETNISFDDDELIDNHYSSSMNPLDEEEYVRMVFDKEISCPNEDQVQLQSGSTNWIKDARFDAIQYILNITTLFGFKSLTAYISITYLDTFLSRRHIDEKKTWAINLLAVACLSLAAKMEECIVPSLSEFTMEPFHFETRVIQRMELFILTTLEWKMIKITPFSFIHFLIPKLAHDSPPKNIKIRISELIFRFIKDVNLMSYRQSVVAAAMTLMALDPRLSKEAMEIRLEGLSTCLPLHIEEVWSCYEKMQVIETESENKNKSASSKCIISPPLSPSQFPYPNDLGQGSSSSTPAVGSKRKRLGFNECDQNTHNFPSNDQKKRQT